MQVIIGMCAHNNLESTKRAIESIEKFKYNTPYQLVVVNDASTDGTADYLNTLKSAIIVTNRVNQGYTKSANGILKHRLGSYGVVLINNDVVVTDGWLDKLVASQYDITGCKILRPDGSTQHEGVKVINRKTIHGNFPECDYVNGSCVFIKSSLLDAIGEFDEIFAPAYHEETDLCLRAKDKGFKVGYDPSCCVYHYVSSSYGSHPKINEIYARSWSILQARWGITG